MALRDRILPVIDRARRTIDSLGLRRYEVAIRRKVWPNQVGNPGDSPAITDFLITPTPRVRIDPPWAEQEVGTRGPLGSYTDRIYTIDKITPHYVNRDGITTGGYTPQDIDLTPASNKEEVSIVLTGDDGVAHECELVSKEFDRAFQYKLKVRMKRRAQT